MGIMHNPRRAQVGELRRAAAVAVVAGRVRTCTRRREKVAHSCNGIRVKRSNGPTICLRTNAKGRTKRSKQVDNITIGARHLQVGRNGNAIPHHSPQEEPAVANEGRTAGSVNAQCELEESGYIRRKTERSVGNMSGDVPEKTSAKVRSKLYKENKLTEG